MSQYILKKPAIDIGALEIDIQRRLQHGKIRLFISHIFFFILTVSIFFFVI